MMKLQLFHALDDTGFTVPTAVSHPSNTLPSPLCSFVMLYNYYTYIMVWFLQYYKAEFWQVQVIVASP